MSVAEALASHPPMREIVEDQLRRVKSRRLDRIERRDVGRDIQAENDHESRSRL